MTRKQAKKTTTPKHPKWMLHKMGLHMKAYCHDTKKEYLDAPNFKRAIVMLMMRTGWTL